MPNWYTPSKSTNIRPVLWLSVEARTFFSNIVNPDFSVLEFGGGGSTKWFSNNCKSVVTVENDINWFNALAKEELSNVSIIYGKTIPNYKNKFDIIFIDGEPIEARKEWVIKSIDCINRDGWIILDNCNRPEYADEREFIKSKAKETVTIDGNENGTLYLVTEFYRL